MLNKISARRLKKLFPPTVLEGGQVIYRVHPKKACANEVCCIHNPSDHHMRDFPQNWRDDRGIMERICPCGIGHPDPDDNRIMSGLDSGVHGCCGHCGIN